MILFLREGRIPYLHQFTMEREREKEEYTVVFARYFTMFSQFRFYQWIKLRGIEK